MNYKSILFRVNASVQIGMGHAYRCFTIAKEILKNHNEKIYFVSENLPINFQNKIKSYGIEVIIKTENNLNEIDFLTNVLIDKGSVALIIDSYKSIYYEENFQKEILKKTTKLIYIVFDNKTHYYAHILHNQNPISLVNNYNTEKYTKKLFGLNNLILDENIRQLSKTAITKKGNINNFHTVLLTFGGSDPYNLTLKALKSLKLIRNKFKKFIVVIGDMYSFEDDLNNFIDSAEINIDLHKNTNKIYNLMLQSDIAFISGGITTWELGALKIPIILLPFGGKVLESAKLLGKLNLAQYVENPLEKCEKKLASEINKILDNNLLKISDNLYNEINIDGVNNFINSLFTED